MQHIPTLLQLVIEIFPIAGGGFHPNENRSGRSIQLVQLLFPDLPPLSGIGKGDRFDDHTFVGSANATRTGLASDINPTNVLDDRSFLRGSGWRHLHCSPSFLRHFPSLFISSHHSPASILLPPRQARNPASQGERQLMLDRQSSLAALGYEPLAVATSLIDP